VHESAARELRPRGGGRKRRSASSAKPGTKDCCRAESNITASTAMNCKMPMDLMFTKLQFSAPGFFREHIAGVDGAGGWAPFYVIQQSRHRTLLRPLWRRSATTIRSPKVMAGSLSDVTRNSHNVLRAESVNRDEDNASDPQRRRERPGRPQPDGPKRRAATESGTPMQWDASANGGLSSQATPWLPVPPRLQKP